MALLRSAWIVVLVTLHACAGRGSDAVLRERAEVSPSSIADPSFLHQYAVTYRFNHGHPGSFRFTPSADAVLFLRSGPRSFVNDLWSLDVATGAERLLLTAEQILSGGDETLSPEERARRERLRLASRGIVSFDVSPDGRTLLVPLSGRLFLVERARAGEPGAVRELTSSNGYPIDPRFSPDGRRVAVVRNGNVFVIEVETGSERQITTRENERVEYGTAEFVAQEEMHRHEGYWWSPDSRALLIQRTASGEVERFHISDPMRPEQAPHQFAYPRPGMPNAEVSLVRVELETGSRSELSWDRARYPYLATVRWSSGAPITLVVQSRDQHELAVLAFEGESQAPRTLWTERDEAWINLDQDVPRWLARAGSPERQELLWTTEREGEWQLELRARDGRLLRTLTPTGFGYHGIEGVDERNRVVWVAASPEPTETRIYAVPIDPPGDGQLAPRLLTDDPGVHSAVVASGGSVWVHTERSLGSARTSVLRRLDGSAIATFASHAEDPPFSPSIEIERAGAREHRAAIVRPRDFDRGRRYPVIVHVYGGPGVRYVTRERDRWLLNQWFADHGFIVVCFDGRGTPGRGRAWERAIDGDFISVPLEDQVAALDATLARHPEMDRNRIGIYGWSFGGYFAAMAALRRPDVYRAAVAGAPVSEWRDYDTHYTERYLGMPEPAGAGGAYDRSSVLPYASADTLHRPLLIVHGTADDNVYFSHAIKLSDALFRAGREHDFLPLAGLTHMVPDPQVTTRLQTRVIRFFQRHLRGPE